MLGEAPGTAGEDFYCSYKSAVSIITHYLLGFFLVIYKLLVHKFTDMGKVTLVLMLAVCGTELLCDLVMSLCLMPNF